MSLLRPEAMAFLARWREVAAAGGAVLAGLWLMSLGGWVLQPLGLILAALALGWGLIALRRLRFQRRVAAPGLVEVDEGQVGFLGPTFGGYLSLRELTEIRLVDLHGKRHWRIRQVDGQVLLIPIAAQGADKLFDAFAALPGIEMARLAAALDAPAEAGVIWSRPA